MDEAFCGIFVTMSGGAGNWRRERVRAAQGVYKVVIRRHLLNRQRGEQPAADEAAAAEQRAAAELAWASTATEGSEEADGSAAAAAAPAADDVASGAERACDARRARAGL